MLNRYAPVLVRVVAVLALILALPAVGRAQESVINGTVADSTGGVLPGVTVTAVHTATGTSFVGVTDERGLYRVPVRVGLVRLTLELPGFATVERTVDVLLGQTVTVNLQMEALPTNRGNWQDLALLAPGNGANSTAIPVPRFNANFQLNMDGQQITNMGPGGGTTQPKYSIKAVGEFQFVSSRWDASQGRSNGVLVNAITKSGTNAFNGTVTGRFRDDRFAADDYVLGRKVDFSNQQGAVAMGGPIVRDKAHFFGYYDREHEPNVVVFATPYPRFNIEQPGTIKDWNGGVRLDYQLAPQQHLMLRGNMREKRTPNTFTGTATSHPSGQGSRRSIRLRARSRIRRGPRRRQSGPGVVAEKGAPEVEDLHTCHVAIGARFR